MTRQIRGIDLWTNHGRQTCIKRIEESRHGAGGLGGIALTRGGDASGLCRCQGDTVKIC
ncbi:hypothetical protein GCM10011498_11320 [Amylibacter cionae]|uniref:Uncharacterized protein n=1 Tax=Neptunicoccus cionae TaxID=2035344 RepID=A0A916QUX3_9RHOB|nr:hypothetical protein GCM10011498_11320 [Amylibacter cionae]